MEQIKEFIEKEGVLIAAMGIFAALIGGSVFVMIIGTITLSLFGINAIPLLSLIVGWLEFGIVFGIANHIKNKDGGE